MWYTVPTVLFLIRAIHQGSDAISPAARGIIWVKFWAYNHAISSPEPSLPLSSGTGKRRPLGSCPQSPRYPRPAERENEDLFKDLLDAFELGISLAINKACAVQPEVDKQ